MKNHFTKVIIVVLSFFLTSFCEKSIFHNVLKKPIEYKNPFFDCPQIDASHVIISPSDCNASNGSIVGLQGIGTGKLVFKWYNVNREIIGTEPDLINVPPGFYNVYLSDEGKCSTPVVMSYHIEENNPILIDYTSAIITPPTCNATDGSISNLKVTAATNYQWVNALDYSTVLSTTTNLTNIGPGTYILTASNAKGCIKQARYIMPPGAYAPVLVGYKIGNSDCAATGTLTATFDAKPNDPLFPYVVTNVAGKEVATGAVTYTPSDSTRIKITDLAAGKYTLTSVSASGCYTKLLDFTIGLDVFQVDISKTIIGKDVCSQNTGAIVVFFKGGPDPPSKPNNGYYWFDAKGNRLPGLGYITNLAAGTYSFYGINSDGCTTPTMKFVIPDSVSTASTPLLDDIKICLSGKIRLNVLNLSPNTRYNLYDSDKNLIDSSSTGTFVRTVETTTTFYVGALYGHCVSPLGKVTVTVVNPGISFPNTFTPNNDGINDHWNISGLDKYPGTEISVYDRSGDLVFHSINYNQPFDGRYHGINLPVGNYYYIIDTKKPGCQNAINGSLTLIR